MFSPDFTQKTTAPTATIAVRPSAVAIFHPFFLRFTGSTASDLLYSALLRSAVFFSSSFSSAIFLFSAVSLVFVLTGSIVFFTLGLTGSVFFLCSSFPSSGTISGTTIFPSSSFAPQLPQNLVASDHSFPHTGHFFILVFLSCPFLSTNLFSLQ